MIEGKRTNAYLLFALIMLGFSCKEGKNTECKYVELSRNLIENIKKRDIKAIKEMLAFDDKDYWLPGGRWELIEKTASKILDTITDVERLRYKIEFHRESKINYAVVSFVISENPPIYDVIKVSFLHPKSPLGCKIQLFDYSRLGTSNKIDTRPVIQSL